MSNELTIRPMGAMISTQEFETVQRVSKLFYESGLFQDTKSHAQACVKVLAGREMGMGPFESMRDINIIKGKTTLAAVQIGARIKASGKYDYRILKLTDTECEIQFLQNGQKLNPTSVFTVQDATKAGLNSDYTDDRTGKTTPSMYKKFPRNMMFSRALTNGARWHCSDVFGGPIYTPDEMGAGLADALPAIDVTPVKEAEHVEQVFAPTSDDPGFQGYTAPIENPNAHIINSPTIAEAVAQAAGANEPTQKQLAMYHAKLKQWGFSPDFARPVCQAIAGSAEYSKRNVSRAIETLSQPQLPDSLAELLADAQVMTGDV